MRDPYDSEETTAVHRVDDAPTVERPAPIAAEMPPPPQRITMRVPAVDDRTLAIARGEREPSAIDDDAIDPFGGLIPVDDEGRAIRVLP